jgi:hypothetical protein
MNHIEAPWLRTNATLYKLDGIPKTMAGRHFPEGTNLFTALFEREEEAERALQCVNACAGIANPSGLPEALRVLHDMSTGSVARHEVRWLATHALNALRAVSGDRENDLAHGTAGGEQQPKTH